MDNLKEKISRIGFTFITLTYIGQARASLGITRAWKKHKTMVKEKDKFIWVDTYIDWCRGCKLMALEYRSSCLMLTQLHIRHRACDKATGLIQRYVVLRANNVEQSQIQGLLNECY